MGKLLYTIDFTVKNAAAVYGVKDNKKEEFFGYGDAHNTVIMEAENMEQAIEVIDNHVKEEYGHEAIISRIEFKNAKVIDSNVGDAMREEIEKMNDGN